MLRRRCPPGTDETAMDSRRLLPEIRWQSRLSPVSHYLKLMRRRSPTIPMPSPNRHQVPGSGTADATTPPNSKETTPLEATTEVNGVLVLTSTVTGTTLTFAGCRAATSPCSTTANSIGGSIGFER